MQTLTEPRSCRLEFVVNDFGRTARSQRLKRDRAGCFTEELVWYKASESKPGCPEDARPIIKDVTRKRQSVMDTLEEVKAVLRDTLQLGARAEGFHTGTPLFGSLPELDSMAVVTIITALEERFDVVFDDDEISAEVFETVGSLTELVQQKL